ncbi:MAG TPA: hypothetical protein PLF22_10745 [Pseudomonadales bacterium]|nr:hypothetical protein [Pseudomonadales bacterium]
MGLLFMGLWSSLFSGDELRQLASLLVADFSDSYPPASKLNSTDKKQQKKFEKAFDRLRCGLVSYLGKNKLNFYKKARLINFIMLDIGNLGYDQEVTELLKKNITTIISLS